METLTLNQIRNRADLFSVVSEFTDLDQRGLGLCPFPHHNDSKPSFKVSQSEDGSQFFHCFGCGSGGSIFNFIMLMEDVSFQESVRILSDRLGVIAATKSEEYSKYYELLNYFQKAYQTQINQIHPYLNSRGITQSDIENFELGYCPGALKLSEDQEQLAFDLGLHAMNFSGDGIWAMLNKRLIFPIRDRYGKLVGFSGRTLNKDDDPKYVNSKNSAIFNKSNILYNYYRAKKHFTNKRRSILVEGYFDVIAMEKAGFPETIATCGTALTEFHALQLKSAYSVILLFDSDSGGRIGADRASSILTQENIKHSIAFLPEGADPDEMYRSGRVPELQQIIDSAEAPRKIAADKFKETKSEQALELFARSVVQMPPVELEAAVSEFCIENDIPKSIVWGKITSYSTKVQKTFKFPTKV